MFRALVIFIVTLASTAVTANDENRCELSFGVVPQQSATVLAKKWIPILAQISEESSCSLNFATSKDIPTFEQQLKLGQYDLAYMNPYHFTVFSKDPGYIAIVHRKNQPIHGILVVQKDFDENNLQTLLSNQTLAFPAPAAFAATVLNQKKLERKGIHFKAQYVSSHDSVYLSVSKGLFKAGGGVMRTFNTIPKDTRDKLKVLWKTEPFTPHAVAASPKIDDAIRLKIGQAFLSLAHSETGKRLLKSIKVKHGFQVPDFEAWQDVDSLNISLIK